MHINEVYLYFAKMRNHHREIRQAFKNLETVVHTGTMEEICAADVAYTETIRSSWEDAGLLQRSIMNSVLHPVKE